MLSAKATEMFKKAGVTAVDGILAGPSIDLRGTRKEYLGILSTTEAVSADGLTVDLTDIRSVILNDDGTLVIIRESKNPPIVVNPGTFSMELRLRLSNIDRSISASYKMPKTDSELNDLFTLLYPGYRNRMYYDVLRERERIDLFMLNPVVYEEGTFVDYNDQIECIYFDSLERRLKALGCLGTPPNIQVRQRVLLTKFYETRRNPFKEWLDTLTWDGKPRVDTWFKKVFSASAPPLEQYGLSDLYLAKVARAWFCGAIARTNKAVVHEIVPVFIGRQGLGKTSGLRYTAGKEEWFIETSVDVASPHGKSEFLDAVRGRVIVEMSEGAQIRTKDQDRLKGFISMMEDQYRKPYQRRDDTFPRHFILAATSNLDDVFTDLTGNRRYYPIYCHEASLSERTQYDVEQVWAEAYAMYNAGEHIYIPAAWYPAMVMQEFATSDNTNVSLFDNYLDNPNNDGGMYTKVGAMITKEELLYKVFGTSQVTGGSPQDHAWKAWLKGTRSWTKTDLPIKVGYSLKPQRAYIRVMAPTQTVFTHGSFKVGTKEELYKRCLEEAEFSFDYCSEQPAMNIEEKFQSKSAITIFNMACKECGIKSEFAEFPADRFLPETVRILADDGLIYYDPSKKTYRTVICPGEPRGSS